MRKIKKKVAAGATIAAIATTGGLSAAIVACSPNKPEEKKPEERNETTPENTTPKQQGGTTQLDEGKEGGKDSEKNSSSQPETSNPKTPETKEEKKPEPEKQGTPLVKLTPAEQLPTYQLLNDDKNPALINLSNFTSSVNLVLNWGTINLGTEDEWKIEVELKQENQETTVKNKPLVFKKEGNEQTLQLTFGTMEDKKEYTVKSVKLKSVNVPEKTVEVIAKNQNSIKFLFEGQENKEVKEEDKRKHVVGILYDNEKPIVLKSNEKVNIKIKFTLDGISAKTDLDRNLALLSVGYQTQDGLKQVLINVSKKIISIINGEATLELDQNDVKLIMDQNPSHIWLIASSIYSKDFSVLRNYRLNYEDSKFVSDYNRQVPLVYIKTPVSIAKN